MQLAGVISRGQSPLVHYTCIEFAFESAVILLSKHFVLLLQILHYYSVIETFVIVSHT